MKRLAVLLICFASCCADQVQDPLARAREHAQHVQGKGAAKAYVELVRVLVDDAGAQYSGQHYDESAKELEEAKDALAKARQSAEQHKHDIKQCDLILDKVDRRLRDYGHSFSAEDRPRVQALNKDVQNLREKLLQILFETK
ncbi:MAG: hypothetical protein NVS9B15_00830 [Acidobacteriaceae bacterium]